VDTSAPEKERRLHAVVRGRVQGIGYRATTMDEARRLGLAGWVRNRLDGSVEVLAEGSQARLDLFLEYLHRGPQGAHVESVATDWDDGRGAPMPFQFKPTA
jgi:acylphosphatase